MKSIACIALFGLLAMGCSAPMPADEEFGVAQMASWERMIAYPKAPHADDPVEGVAGISAEEIMDVHNRTFAEKPQEIQVFQFEMKGGQ